MKKSQVRRTKWWSTLTAPGLCLAWAGVAAAGAPAPQDETLRAHFIDGETTLRESDVLWRAQSWADFESKTRQLAYESLRLIDVEIIVEDGHAHYVGVWRAGSGNFSVWTCPTWAVFSQRWQAMSMHGLQLIDIEVYAEQGKTVYFGLFREDMSEAKLASDQDWNDISQ